MTRFLIGLFLGLAIAAAAAQITIDVTKLPNTAMRAGFDPDGTAHVIQVDRQGYVICSDDQKPQEVKPDGQ